MLAAGDLRAAFAQRGGDHFRERDVRDAVLRERRRELRRRNAPDLRGVRTEEQAVERPPHRLHHPVLGGDERARPESAAQRLDRIVRERARREDRRHRLRDVEGLERVLVVLAAELDPHVLRARGETVGGDVLEHVEHPLVPRVIRVWPEVKPRSGLAAEGRGEAAQEMLGFDERDALTVFGQ